MKSLPARALASLARRFITVAALLFLPGLSLDFWRAWIYLSVWFVPQLLMSLYFLRNVPDLLERRLKGGPPHEKRVRQKWVMLLVIVFITSSLLVCGLDHRFNWSHVPIPLIVLGNVMVLIGFLVQFQALKENRYASVVIEVGAQQQVISTGPYAVVRHPFYSGALLANLFAPLALGSWWALPFAFGWLIAVVVRLLDEEKLLQENLPGYEAYCQRVPYRLIPHVR